MIRKPRREGCSRLRRLIQVGLCLVLGLLAALVAEHWRGGRALKAWKQEKITRGEVFEVARLWPSTSEQGADFSNQLARAISQLPPGLETFTGRISGMAQDEPGEVRRGSQEPQPWLGAKETSTNTWQNLEAAIQEAQGPLRTLQQLMNDPPPTMGYNIQKQLETEIVPNFVNVRKAAQALHAVALNALHQGNLAAALENLQALASMVRFNEQDPSLVNYMIRVAVSGLGVDVFWDALQADGWTEPQLAALQSACQSNLLLPQLSRTFEAERLARVHLWTWFRSHSYEQWMARYLPIYQSFGLAPPAYSIAPQVVFWRQWIFHPTWSYAWADQEELNYLRHAQVDLDILRQAIDRKSWIYLSSRSTVAHQNYRHPKAAWRFYIQLPLVEEPCRIIGSTQVAEVDCPYQNYSKAWFATFKNLALQQMVLTAIALKRHELRHGKLPATLTLLTPEFLADTPRDLMDGQPLRYGLRSDASLRLYSVGQDARDDGGNPLPATAPHGQGYASPWDGRDWVWPNPSRPVR